jgi:hypothetical protein
MANTFDLITRTEVAGGSTSVLFSTIPQTYDDLFFKFNLNSTYTAGGTINLYMQVNTSSGPYRMKYMAAYGTASGNLETNTFNETTNLGYSSQRLGHMVQTSRSGSANMYSCADMMFCNYRNATGFAKGYIVQSATSNNAVDASGAQLTSAGVGRWNSGDAATSIRFIIEDAAGTTFNAGGSISMYGISRT